MLKPTNWPCLTRPKAEVLPASALRALLDSEGRLPVRVIPGARRESVEILDGRLLVKVRMKPDDSNTNLR